MKPLTIILVTFNRLEYTRRTLYSLQQTVPHAKLIVWDNGSTEDNMVDWLRVRVNEMFPTAILIESKENVGWGAAVNACMEHVTKDDDYILLSNNDVEYHDGWYERALAVYASYASKIGILALWKHTAHGVLVEHPGLVIKDQMPAVAWLVRKHVLYDVGAMSQHGPCETKGGNGEDVDYCIRVHQAGLWVCAPKEDLATHIDGY
jgi:GT2 family glycosyltransferase